MLPTKFRFIWQSGFRGEDFLEINQSETRIAYGSKKSSLKSLGQMNQNLVGSILGRSSIKIAHFFSIIFIEVLPMMLPTKFRFIWQSSFRVEDF
jgi:hypothetical protein